MELIFFVIISIILSIFLDKRSKVFNVLHAILFILILVPNILITDIDFVKTALINLLGRDLYDSIREILLTYEAFYIFGIHTLLLLDVLFSIIFAMAMVLIFVKEQKKVIGKIIRNCLNFNLNINEANNNEEKCINSIKTNRNKSYLYYGKLLN